LKLENGGYPIELPASALNFCKVKNLKFAGNFVNLAYAISRTRGVLLTTSTIALQRAMHSPAAERNKEPIRAPLEPYLNQILDDKDKRLPPVVLEVASGCGTHVGYLSQHFTNIKWIPTEKEDNLINNIRANVLPNSASANIEGPFKLDITEWRNFDIKATSPTIDAMFNANMMHISPWECSESLFAAAGAWLKSGGSGRLFTYGPFAINGVIEPESNARFDRTLRQQNSDWGYRDVKDLIRLAEMNNLCLEESHEMPANNKLLVWKKS